MDNLSEELKNSYNKISQKFSSTRNYLWKEFEAFSPYLKKDMTVLDMGCGNGRLINFLKPYLLSYIGVDFSKNLIKEALKKHKEYKFVCCDMISFTGAKKIDVIFSIASFHHITSFDKRIKTLKNWKKMLTSNGVICMTVWNLWQKKYFWNYLESYIFGCFKGRHPKGVMIPWRNSKKEKIADRYYYSFTKKDIYKLAEKSGLKVDFMEYYKNGKISKNKWNAHNLVIVLSLNDFKLVKINYNSDLNISNSPFCIQNKL